MKEPAQPSDPAAPREPQHRPDPAAPASDALARAGPLEPGVVLALQRRAGNAAVQRALLQRQDAGAGRGTAPAAPAPAAARPTFQFTNARGGFTRFDAGYTPVGPAPQVGALDIELRVHITFAPFTRRMMRRPEFRAHRWTRQQLADFAWTDGERETFRNGFVSSVHSAWSGRHTFHLDDPAFAEYRCRVNVNVVAVEERGRAHMRMTAQKVPRGAPRFRSFVSGDEATLDIRDPTEPETRTDNSAQEIVRQIGPFALNSADLTPALTGQVHALADRLRPLQNATQTDTLLGETRAVDFVGRSSSPGTREHNQALGQRRAEAVERQLGVELGRASVRGGRSRSVGEQNASADPGFQRVDVMVWNVDRAMSPTTPPLTQNVAAHEAGHMFGLGDEYVEERPPRDVTPKFLGDRPSHYGDVEALMGTEAADELLVHDSGSMMSQGGDVRRGHYVYFLEALNDLTGKRWSVE